MALAMGVRRSSNIRILVPVSVRFRPPSRSNLAPTSIRVSNCGSNAITSLSAFVARAMTTGHYLDFLGISMDPKNAEGPEFTVNLVTPDNGEKYIVELSNATIAVGGTAGLRQRRARRARLVRCI